MIHQESCNDTSRNVTIFDTMQNGNVSSVDWTKFGLYLEDCRVKADLTQERAAELAEMKRLQWSRITKGDSGTKRDTVIRMATAVHADINKALKLAGYAPISEEINGHPDITEINELANQLAQGVMAAGYNDLRDPELREAFLEDMKTIAESMLKRKLDEQRKRKKR